MQIFYNDIQAKTEVRPEKRDYYYPFGLTISSAAGVTGQPYKYQGIELEKSFGLEMYETKFRGLDPQLGRFTQIDPKADQFVFQSPYVSMDNNPIRKIDPLGLSASSPDDYVFNEKGNYVRTDKTNQPDKLVIENSQTKQKTNYEFNDPKVDALAIRNGVLFKGSVGITRVEFASDALVEKQIERSGVRDKQAQKYPLTYAKQQGAFKMDYGVKGVLARDLKSNTFYIRGNIAYNVGDFGNYLWGKGMGILGIDLGTARRGAHWNNFWNGRQQKVSLYDFGPGTYGDPGILDSPGDQRAIKAGHATSPQGLKEIDDANRAAELHQNTYILDNK